MTTEHASQLQIGDYVVTRELGKSLFGTIYLAQHCLLQEEHLLTALPESSPGLRARLKEEAVRLAKLDHSHVLKLSTITEIEGKFYLVYESPRGATFLKGDLPENTIYQIAKQLASALDYVHNLSYDDQPLAHGSLKESSLYLHPERGVLIGHFGLSRIVGMEEIYRESYKALWDEGPNHLLEHLACSAPEIKRHPDTSRDTDALGDIYSFGVILYHLLTGKRPEGLFPMPSECERPLAHDWDPLIRACLQLDPEKRPLELTSLLPSAKGTASPRPKLAPKQLTRPKYESDPAAVFQVDKTVAIYTPKPEEVKEMDPLLTDMIVIEGGTFLRGCNNGARDEMPRHAVHLPAYAIDIHPVTNEQFVRFLAVMGGEKDGNNNDTIRLRDSRIRRGAGKLTIESGYAKHPVVGVTWFGALAYAKWVGKRLPTEAEWEVAACGGVEGAQYPTGDAIERPQANFFNADTTTIKSYPANGYGIFDVAGNVYEWCMDWYGYHYYEASLQQPDNPRGPKQGVYRVLRGGCWKSLKEDLRCSHRHRNKPGIVNGTYGFRCVADVTS